MSRETFLSNQDIRDVACYRLLIAIEAALALCFHVSAKRLHQVPEEYAGCFATLEQAGLIPTDLSSRLQQMARFRNLARSCVLEDLMPDLTSSVSLRGCPYFKHDWRGTGFDIMLG